MELNEYQKLAKGFDQAPNELWYYALGLTGEAGELADKIKKSYRNGAIPLDRIAAAYELGDVLWYVAATATKLGFSLELISIMNLVKLNGRKERGTLVGEGDNR